MCSVPQVPMDQSFGLSGAAWNHWLARRTIPAGQQLTAAGSQLRTFHCLIYAVNWGLCVFTWDHSWWNLESLDNLDIFQRFSESTVLMIRKMPRLAEIGDLWKSAPSYRPRASEFVFGAAQVWAWSSDPRRRIHTQFGTAASVPRVVEAGHVWVNEDSNTVFDTWLCNAVHV